MTAESAAKMAKSESSSNTKTRSSRDLSFKPRFRHLYGLDEKYYEFALRYKDSWQDKLFYVDEKLVIGGGSRENKKVFPVISDAQLVMDEIKGNSVRESEFLEAFGVSTASVKVKLSRGKSMSRQEQLQFSESAPLGASVGRMGLVLNTGGHVTSMQWLRDESESQPADSQILAVSIIKDPHGIESSIRNPELSIMSRKALTTIKSGIQIWRYDLSTNDLKLVCFYETSSLGATNNLRWLPVTLQSSHTLGVLVGSFTDGKLHFLKIPKAFGSEPEYAIVEIPSLSYEFLSGEGEKSGTGAGITDYDFVGFNKVLVGTSNGFVSEYTLPISKDDTKASQADVDNSEIPSYVQRITDSAINSIMVAEVDPSQYVTIINTAGTECWAFENRNPKGRILPSFSTISPIKLSYNSSLKVFIGSFSTDSLSFNFIRGPQEAPNNLLKMDGAVTCLKSSEYVGHPLNICGSSNGEIFVINYSRKFLNGSKMTNKTLSPLRLWKASLIGDTISLLGDLIPVPSEKQTNISVTPPESIISSLAWNENDLGSSIYTAGLVGGLIILERLDPSYT